MQICEWCKGDVENANGPVEVPLKEEKRTAILCRECADESFSEEDRRVFELDHSAAKEG